MDYRSLSHPGIDYHLHSDASHDGTGSLEEYCVRASDAGFRELGFANHMDLHPCLSHAGTYDHERFLREVEQTSARYPDIVLRIGVEVTYHRELEGEIYKALSGLKLDYVLGSVHIVGENCFSITEREGAERYFQDKFSPPEAYGPYFDTVMALVKSGLFDALGHMDVIKKFASAVSEFYESFDIREFYGPVRKILEGMMKRDMALEVNTSGLFHPVEEIYPSSFVLKLYRELGGERVIVGSDAHRPGELGRGLDEAVEMLRGLGFGELTVFENRMPRQVPLP